MQLKVACNILHLRTCSDSFQLLASLIIYLATEGDLEPQSQQASSDPVLEPSQPVSSPDSDSRDSIPDLMADAMEEEDEELGETKFIRANFMGFLQFIIDICRTDLICVLTP